MAMAAVRACARKLGVLAHRPTQASASFEQPLLAIYRPLHSQTKKLKAASLLAEIQKTKEELFRQMFENREVLGYENCGLLKHLCLEVEPRPDDHVWLFYRRAKLINYFWKCAGPLFSGYVGMHLYTKITESKEVADASNNKEQQEQPLI